MTRKIFSTDLTEIKTIKVMCRECGYAVDVPLINPGVCPEGCFFCKTEFPVKALTETIKALNVLQRTLSDPDNLKYYAKAKVLIETVEGEMEKLKP